VSVADHPLRIALSAAVPLLILELEARGGPSELDYGIASAFGQELAERGDIWLFGGKKGEAADLFKKLAKSIAVLAFCPGGVTIFGQAWESKGEPSNGNR